MRKFVRKMKRTYFGKLLANIYYWYVDLVLRRNDYVVRICNSFFYLPYIRTDEIQKTIFQRKYYMEGHTLDYICKEWHDGIIDKTMKESAVLDIGANIGNHTLYFLRECQAQFAYCFEPVKETFDILTKNICINNLGEKVQLLNVGVGSNTGEARIKSSRNKDTGYTNIELSSGGGISVVAIDRLRIHHHIGLVKIDVEGFELEVVKGMVHILKKDRPLIMIEIWNNNLDDILRILYGLGYQSEILDRRDLNTDYLFF